MIEVPIKLTIREGGEEVDSKLGQMAINPTYIVSFWENDDYTTRVEFVTHRTQESVVIELTYEQFKRKLEEERCKSLRGHFEMS